MPIVALKDVIQRITGNEDRLTTSLEYYVGGEHYDSDELEIHRKGRIKDEDLGFKFHFPFEPGDTLFMARNPHLRKASRVNFKGICSDASYILRTKDESILLQDFVPIILQSDDFWSFFTVNKTGSVNPLLNWSTLSNYSFNLPKIDTQRRFSEIVWLLQSDLNNIRERLNLLDEVIKSRFIEMFGTFSDPKYGVTKVGALVTNKIVRVSKVYDSDDAIQYIDISSIDKESRMISSTTTYYVKDAPSRAQQCVVKGDILFSNVRPNLKTIAIVDSESDNLVCSSGFTVLRCLNSEPEYLITALLDDSFTNSIVKKETGSNYPAVTSKDVLNANVPSAPIEVQKDLSSFVKQVDKSRFELQRHLEDTKKLQKALINQAFEERTQHDT